MLYICKFDKYTKMGRKYCNFITKKKGGMKHHLRKTHGIEHIDINTSCYVVKIDDRIMKDVGRLIDLNDADIDCRLKEMVVKNVSLLYR